MASNPALTWSYTEEFIPESEPARTARLRAAEHGISPVSCGGGAFLRFLAASLSARAVAEIGSGTGVSGMWLLEGMDPNGVLTTIDIEPEYLAVAREVFESAGIRPSRTRLITGRALSVLPRLADAAYDMVVLDGDPEEVASTVEQAWRILRPGGVLVVVNALAAGRVADPARRDQETVEMRELIRDVRDREDATVTLLPVGAGLLAAVKNET